MSRERSSWGETVALILRDCEPEVRLEFMRSLGQWKRNSINTIKANSDITQESYEGDLRAAETRLVKLQALEEHLQREMDSDRRWRAMLVDSLRRWGS